MNLPDVRATMKSKTNRLLEVMKFQSGKNDIYPSIKWVYLFKYKGMKKKIF